MKAGVIAKAKIIICLILSELLSLLNIQQHIFSHTYSILLLEICVFHYRNEKSKCIIIFFVCNEKLDLRIKSMYEREAPSSAV